MQASSAAVHSAGVIPDSGLQAVFEARWATTPFLSRRFPEVKNTFLNFVCSDPDHQDCEIAHHGASRGSLLQRSKSWPGFIEVIGDSDERSEDGSTCDAMVRVDTNASTEFAMQIMEVPRRSPSNQSSASCSTPFTSEIPDESCEQQGTEGRTTLAMHNLPRYFSQLDILSALDSDGVPGACDLCYMPVDFRNGSSRGYAFVNFRTPEAAAKILQTWDGSRRFCSRIHKKLLEVQYARVQGLDAQLSQLHIRKALRIRNPLFRPIIRREDAS